MGSKRFLPAGHPALLWVCRRESSSWLPGDHKLAPQEKGGMASYPGIKATLVTGDVIGKIKAGKVRPHPIPPSHRARRPGLSPLT